MDELSAFKFAPPSIKLLELELMEKADVVFTGGHSLFKAKQSNHANIFSFPSSIDKTHFLTARNIISEPADQENIDHPRLGYYGVIDERININLIEQIASKRPDWQIILIGPVVKINPDSLPRRNNIHYLGSKDYKQLPEYLAGWDIAIMPFALNKSTEYISPTKTPEYLCGGKPVISTSVRDVVLQYGVKELVHIADTANEFIKAAESILRSENYHQWLKSVDEFLADMSWDNTYESMKALIEKTLEKRNVQQQI
jgi:UDP-galactopyranose mutase